MTVSRMKISTICAGMALCVCVWPATKVAAQVNPMSNRTIPADSPDAGAGDSPQGSRDRLFLHGAAEGGMAEVQLAQLALQKSSNDDVKKFAQKMVDDHTALNDSLAPFAKSMGAKPPKKLAKGDQTELAKLSGLSGRDFDKEYLAYMVKDHRKDLADFHQEAQTASTPDLKAAVAKGEATVHEHLDMVQKLAQANGAETTGK